MINRTIPASGEELPVMGLGTWQTFNVSSTRYPALLAVLKTMHAAGARLIDSSPMYGRAEEVVGDLTGELPEQKDFFYATKVWTTGAEAGKQQIKTSYRHMKTEVIDLLQIHNLVDWKTHLPYLKQLKEEGKLRYIGVTHYQDSSHNDLAAVLKQEPLDFVQFNYSILSRHAEKTLFPICADKGIATLINRPFGEGSLFGKVINKSLPAWAEDYGIKNWSAYFLKFILANPAVTCVIPATGNPLHAAQNFEAGNNNPPGTDVVRKMVEYIEKM